MEIIEFRCWSNDEKKMYNIGRLDFPNDKIIVYMKDYEQYTKSTIDNFIIMQYTGLKDKNGNKIFSGDIVETDDGDIGKIVFIHGAYRIDKGKDYLKEHTSLLYQDLETETKDILIVGNVHQNPELLK